MGLNPIEVSRTVKQIGIKKIKLRNNLFLFVLLASSKINFKTYHSIKPDKIVIDIQNIFESIIRKPPLIITKNNYV